MKRSAWIEDEYRYELRRTWGNPKGRIITWVMLNPSTADGAQDDATLRRIIDFSERWGNHGLVVVNLFALRATDPRELKRHHAPEGRHNRQVLARVLAAPGTIVAAWGANPMAVEPARWFRDRAMDHDVTLHCLGLTSKRAPVHPLRQPKSAGLRVYRNPFATDWEPPGLACADGEARPYVGRGGEPDV